MGNGFLKKTKKKIFLKRFCVPKKDKLLRYFQVFPLFGGAVRLFPVTYCTGARGNWQHRIRTGCLSAPSTPRHAGCTQHLRQHCPECGDLYYDSYQDFVTRKAPFYIYDAIRPAQERLTYAAVISLTDRNGLGKKSGFIPVRFPPAASWTAACICRSP